MNNLSEQDYCQWAQEQAQRLAAGQTHRLDTTRLAQELRKLAQETEHQLQTRFGILLVDLLVWQYNYDFRSYPQKCRIETQRDDIQHLLYDNPGLKSRAPELFSAAYPDAIYEAALRTQHWFTEFHTDLWTMDDVLDEQFWPELWPESAREDGFNHLRKQPWFQQEILRAIDEWGYLPPETKPKYKKAI